MTSYTGTTVFGIDGASVSAYNITRLGGGVGTPPPYDTSPAVAIPDGLAPDVGPVTTGEGFGGGGSWALDLDPAHRYLILEVYHGHFAWSILNPDAPAVTALAALTDVALTSPSNGDRLVFNTGAGKWENSPEPADTDHPVPTGGTTGQVLTKHSNTDYDVDWETVVSGGGGSSTLAGDTDVSITSPADGDVLTYVTADGKWENRVPTGGGGGGGSGGGVSVTLVDRPAAVNQSSGTTLYDVPGATATVSPTATTDYLVIFRGEYQLNTNSAIGLGVEVDGTVVAPSDFVANATSGFGGAVVDPSNTAAPYTFNSGSIWESSWSVVITLTAGTHTVKVVSAARNALNQITWKDRSLVVTSAWKDLLSTTGPTPDTPPSTPNAADYEFSATATAPPTGWAWVNQGSATYDESEGLGSIYIPHSGGNPGTAVVRSIPAGTPTMTMKIAIESQDADYTQAGVVLHESSTGKQIWFAQRRGGAIDLALFNADHSYAGTTVFATNVFAYGPYIYLRVVKHSSTNWDFLFSRDGKTFIPLQTGYNPTSFCTPDEIGFGSNNTGQTGSLDQGVSCDYFRVA